MKQDIKLFYSALEMTKQAGERCFMREGCGIAGIALTQEDAALPIFYALYALQHRGQESAGIAVSTGEDFKAKGNEIGESAKDITLARGMGFVYEVFNKHRLESLKGNIGIGHVRYSTTGASREENAEPLLVNYRKGKIGILFSRRAGRGISDVPYTDIPF